LLDRVEDQMQRIGLGNFLGSDPRNLSQILNDDQDRIHASDLTHEQIARRLADIAAEAKQQMGETALIDGRYEVTVNEFRGRIPCPWAHPEGLFPKTHVELIDLESGATLKWTDLSVHLIAEHGFYQGRGSPYRLEPDLVVRLLFA
jgi:hypothetical protein